jgi:hypothetical protein
MGSTTHLHSEHRVRRPDSGDALAHQRLHEAVGVGHRRVVVLGVDVQVGGAEARHGDGVGEAGELQRQREVVLRVTHARRARRR